MQHLHCPKGTSSSRRFTFFGAWLLARCCPEWSNVQGKPRKVTTICQDSGNPRLGRDRLPATQRSGCLSQVRWANDNGPSAWNEAIYLLLVNLICQGVSLAKGWQPRFLFVGDTDIRGVGVAVELDNTCRKDRLCCCVGLKHQTPVVFYDNYDSVMIKHCSERIKVHRDYAI